MKEIELCDVKKFILISYNNFQQFIIDTFELLLPTNIEDVNCAAHFFTIHVPYLRSGVAVKFKQLTRNFFFLLCSLKRAVRNMAFTKESQPEVGRRWMEHLSAFFVAAIRNIESICRENSLLSPLHGAQKSG